MLPRICSKKGFVLAEKGPYLSMNFAIRQGLSIKRLSSRDFHHGTSYYFKSYAQTYKMNQGGTQI
jgi:hypothetical protein